MKVLFSFIILVALIPQIGNSQDKPEFTPQPYSLSGKRQQKNIWNSSQNLSPAKALRS